MSMRAYANGVWFTAAPGRLSGYHYEDDFDATNECRGCAFNGRPASECIAAGAAAAEAGLPDCESRPGDADPGYVYRREVASDGN
jgi:hypothetical protein